MSGQRRYQPSSVRDWTAHAGLDHVNGLSEYLETLASTRLDLAFLSDDDWQQVLAPLELKLGKARRVEAAIDDLRQSRPIWSAEDEEVLHLQQMFASGGSAQHRSPAQVEFFPAASFSGPRSGFVFKHGQKGLGYYRDQPANHALSPHHRHHHRQQQANRMLQYEVEHEAAIQGQQGGSPQRLIRQRQREQALAMHTPQRGRSAVEPEISPRTAARAAAHARLMARPF